MTELAGLLLVRHGQCVGNVANDNARAAGAHRLDLDHRDADTPLSESGVGQARAVGAWLGGLPEDARPTARTIPCLEATALDVASVAPGRVDPRAGRAAFDYLVAAIDLALAGRVDAITTLPLNKEALHAGGINHPGHTEILAERCGVTDHAMMLYVGPPLGAPTPAWGSSTSPCTSPSGGSSNF